MSNHKSPNAKPVWWNRYWIAVVIVTIIIAVTLPILRQVPWETAAIILLTALIFEGLAYYGRTKPSIQLNRIMYLLIGVPVGFVIWFISWFFIVRVAFPHSGENLGLVIISLVICFGIGALIGDLIGKTRHYKGPEQYQP